MSAAAECEDLTPLSHIIERHLAQLIAGRQYEFAFVIPIHARHGRVQSGVSRVWPHALDLRLSAVENEQLRVRRRCTHERTKKKRESTKRGGKEKRMNVA